VRVRRAGEIGTRDSHPRYYHDAPPGLTVRAAGSRIGVVIATHVGANSPSGVLPATCRGN